MSIRQLGVIVLWAASPVFGEVFSYECDSLPLQAGWVVGQNFCDPAEWVEDGRFYQRVEFCEGYDPPAGQQSSYNRSLSDFAGISQFVAEWRMATDGHRSELYYTAPASLVVGNNHVYYHFTIASDQVRFIRDVGGYPILWFDIEPDVPHTYRLELYGSDLYLLYIDSAIVDFGVPEDPAPASNSIVGFRAKAQFVESTTQWDYIRWGSIPQPASGDFDSDGDVDSEDLYFFADCLLGPDADGPGCLWADLNADGITDGQDIGLFVDALLAPPQPARAGPGVQSVSFDTAARE
jgi:hypothetical protein